MHILKGKYSTKDIGDTMESITKKARTSMAYDDIQTPALDLCEAITSNTNLWLAVFLTLTYAQTKLNSVRQTKERVATA